MASESRTEDIADKMAALKTRDDARRLSEDRTETMRLAQAVQDTRLGWTIAKNRAKLAKELHELAQWELEANCNVQLDEAEAKRRAKGRQQALPGLRSDDGDEGE